MKSRSMLAAVLLVAILLGGVFVGIEWYHRISKNENEHLPAQPNGGIAADDKDEILTPEFRLTAVDLTKEFITDVQAAKKKYDVGIDWTTFRGKRWPGKVLEVTGQVDHVGPTLDQFFLKGLKKKADDALPFRIRIGIEPARYARVARLSTGQNVRIVGKYFTLTEPFYLTLTECVITELEPSKTLAVDAPELAKEFETDAEAATAKYLDKDLLVTGTIEAIRTDDLELKTAVMKGTAATRVTTYLGLGSLSDKAAPGTVVEFRARVNGLMLKDNELDIVSELIVSIK